MILGIDTSLGTSVAVVDPDGAVLADVTSPDPLGHAEVIGDLLTAAIADAARGPIGATGVAASVRLTHVAVGMGPGPFTGLRVGIAAARAFALGRGIPVVPVASHDAVALALLLADPFAEPVPFAVTTDARRREFAWTGYAGLDDDGLPVRLAPAALCPRDALDALLAERRLVRRDAASVSAAMIALAAARALAAGRVIGPSEPLYLRSPDVTLAVARKRVTA